MVIYWNVFEFLKVELFILWLRKFLWEKGECIIIVVLLWENIEVYLNKWGNYE